MVAFSTNEKLLQRKTLQTHTHTHTLIMNQQRPLIKGLLGILSANFSVRPQFSGKVSCVPAEVESDKAQGN